MALSLTSARQRLTAARTPLDPEVWGRLVRLSLALSALVAVYIVAAVLLVPPGEAAAFNFVDERGAVTALSAVFLAMACGFAFVTLWFTSSEEVPVRVFWTVATLALGFLVLDELLQFHERLGGKLDEIDASGLGASGAVRGWNDWVVIAYGVVALAGGGIFLSTLLRYPAFVRLIVVAFAFYVLHTAVDSLVEPPTTLSVIVEESAKLFCSQFFALACLSGVLRHARPVPPLKTDRRFTPEASGADTPSE